MLTHQLICKDHGMQGLSSKEVEMEIAAGEKRLRLDSGTGEKRVRLDPGTLQGGRQPQPMLHDACLLPSIVEAAAQASPFLATSSCLNKSLGAMERAYPSGVSTPPQQGKPRPPEYDEDSDGRRQRVESIGSVSNAGIDAGKQQQGCAGAHVVSSAGAVVASQSRRVMNHWTRSTATIAPVYG
jgi:hypothetical protein